MQVAAGIAGRRVRFGPPRRVVRLDGVDLIVVPEIRQIARRLPVGLKGLEHVDAAALPPIDELGGNGVLRLGVRVDRPNQRRIKRQGDRHRAARRDAVFASAAAIDVEAVLAVPGIAIGG